MYLTKSAALGAKTVPGRDVEKPRMQKIRLSVIQRPKPAESPTLVSDANPVKRIASEKEAQWSGRSFRRQAEAEPSVLCDDAGTTQYVVATCTNQPGDSSVAYAPSE